ncbi:MAG: hypothetical protein KIT27_08480 [Legionellales bacterium]|nr:hypothetical protein [Legionellales bacterium]
MIELKPQPSNLALQQDISFTHIIKRTYPCYDHYTNVYFDPQFNNFFIKEPVGNAEITASHLIFFPTLAKKLRNLKHYPTYTINVDLTKITQRNEKGIQSTIDSFQQLDSELATHRQIKASLDATVNNLIMLYSQDKVIPRYEGEKPYYTRHGGGLSRAGYLIKISGVTYFNKVSPKVFKPKIELYRLCPDALIKLHIDPSAFNALKLPYIRYLAGGVINTPIFILRCAKKYGCRGKLVYCDLHSGKLTTLLSIARKWAYRYARDVKFQIFEGKH